MGEGFGAGLMIRSEGWGSGDGQLGGRGGECTCAHWLTSREEGRGRDTRGQVGEEVTCRERWGYWDGPSSLRLPAVSSESPLPASA